MSTSTVKLNYSTPNDVNIGEVERKKGEGEGVKNTRRGLLCFFLGGGRATVIS